MARKIKHQRTPEQRREQMTQLHDTITTQVEELRDSGAWQDMLDAMSRFHAYSINNLLLIMAQRPDATRVAGYGAWRKTHGRQVRKGEKGIKIIGGGTVKRTEQSVSDDAVLPHDSLVNVDNAQRWIDELSDYLEDLGMSHNANLQGESFRLTTVGLNNLSYNSASNQFKEQAEAEAASLTNGDWEDYEFNYMLRSVDNGEYAIVVAVNRIPYNQ